MRRSLALLLPLTLFSACKQDTNFNQLFPRIATAPDAVDFGEIAVPLEGVEQLFITNNGRAPLTLDAELMGDDVFRLDVPATVERGETVEVPITFAPTTFLDYSATLVLNSNDDDTPTVSIPLLGVGVDAPMPDIAVTPLTVDFGEAPPGGAVTQFLTLRNNGDADLDIGSLSQTGSGAFVLQSDPSNNVVGPNSEVPIILNYLPFGDVGDSGELVIPSNDPDTPEVTVILLGNGGGDFEYPIADIDCPGISGPPIWVNLDGSGSSDPNGLLPLTYEWSLLSKPNGSQADLTNLTSDSTDIFTDTAGLYEIQLVVTNSAGTVSAPDRCVIDAVPEDALHVELSWDTPAADLDLHVARNGAAIFTPGDDCSFCNGSPNWGGPGNDDDPRLDLDDQGGFGPENINIREPSESSFNVRVHYWEEHGDDVVNAEVKVYTYGVLAWEGQRAMQRNEVWDVGEVNWPDGTFGFYSVPNEPSPTRSCTP